MNSGGSCTLGRTMTCRTSGSEKSIALASRYRTANLLGVETSVLRMADVIAMANEGIASRTKFLIGVVNDEGRLLGSIGVGNAIAS